MLGFKAATTDALAGMAYALDASVSPAGKWKAPKNYNVTDTSFKERSNYSLAGLFAKGYLTAKSYLTGNLIDLTKNTVTDADGNTPLTGATNAATGNLVPSPIDLAIYSVLSGKTFNYQTIAGSKPTVISNASFETKGNSATNADWISDAAQNDMYQPILNVANQAKSDFLADVQLQVNKGQSANLGDITKVLPTATSQGMLTDSQYAYYKQNSYVYYKVFQALYNSYLTTTKDGKTVNVINEAIKDADAYVKANGDSNYGYPTAQDIKSAQDAAHPELTASANGTTIKLNADNSFNTASSDTMTYSEDDTGKPASGINVISHSTTSATGQNSSESDIDGNALDGTTNSAKQIIQNAINYAYVHEESVAIPAYEAGYAAVQTGLNATPNKGESPLGDPKSAAFTYENKNTITDVLTPILSENYPDGSTQWQVHYSNADGTESLVTVKRAKAATNGALGAVTGLEVSVLNGSTVLSDSGMTTVADGATTVQSVASYTTLTMNSSMSVDVSDARNKSTVTVAYDKAGNLNYTFLQDVVNKFNTSVTDGTDSGTLFQAGWDYRKSFISENTLIQQVADKQFKNDQVKSNDNRLTDDQVYAGFFENNDPTTNKPVVGDEENNAVQLDPSTDVSGNYGTFAPKEIDNIDGSKVEITLNADGDLTYTVYDVNGKQTATNPSGVLKAGTDSITVTNNDATDADLTPSYVVISRTANKAITIHEVGVQAKAVSYSNVINNGEDATATAALDKNMEPSVTTTTIVTPVSAIHKGVLFTKDTSFGTDGVQSVYDDLKDANGKSLTNGAGLTYQGKTNGSTEDTTTTPSTPAYYGEAENTTTTIQYVAINATNSGTGTTAAIDTSTTTPTITITLGTDNGVVKSSSSFVASGVTAANTGTNIFDWTSLKNLPSGWVYNDTNKTLTYTPQTDADKTALIAALATGTYHVNFSAEKDATAPALLDSYNDVMNLDIDASVKSQTSMTKTIDTSTADVDSSDSHTFSNVEIVDATANATANADPNGLVTAFIKKMAGTSGQTYTGTMNGMVLAKGVSAVTLNTDGSVTVKYDPDTATANYDAATNTNTIKLVLPFTVGTDGNYLPDKADDATGATPLADLTLNMEMTVDATTAYQAAAGGANTSVKNGSTTTNVAYVTAGSPLQDSVSITGAVLGSAYTVTALPTIDAKDTTNFQDATYKLINGSATNNPTAVNLTNTQLKFGKNTQTYLYAKTYGTMWNITPTAPTLTDTAKAVADGVTTTVDLGNAAAGFDTKGLAFDADATDNYTATVALNGTTLNIKYTPKSTTPADVLNFLQDEYTTGFALNGWLTDKTSDGTTVHNALYVKTLSTPLALKSYDKKATINVSKTGNGYDATAHTYTFAIPSDALNATELAALASTGSLTLTNGSSTSDIAKGYATVNAANWKNISAITITMADGVATVVATLTPTVVADSNVQNAAILFNSSADATPTANGLHLELTLTNDLTQTSAGLPITLQPGYSAQNDQAIGEGVPASTTSTPAITGYQVTGATDQNGVTLAITKNADGSASYTADKIDFGSTTGAFKRDQITWQYTQAEITGTIGNQTIVYGADDPTTAYSVTGLPSWLTQPKWAAADFERDNDTSTEVGSHNIKLSAQGIKDLAAVNQNYTITADTLSKITDGTLTITAVDVQATTNHGSRKFNTKTYTDDHTDQASGQAYLPALTLTVVGAKPATNTNLLRDLDFLADTNPLDNVKLSAADVFWFDDKDKSQKPIDMSTVSHAGKYDWKLNEAGKKDVLAQLGKDYTMTDAQLSAIEGSYSIDQGDATATATSASRDYDGQAFTQNHNDSAGTAFAPTFNFDADSGLDAWTIPDGDYTFTDANGKTVAAADLKNAGTYTCTLNDAGKSAFYDYLGSRDGSEADTNYALATASKLSGTYTINKVPLTITGPMLNKAYDGKVYDGKDDVGTVTSKPTAGADPEYQLTDLSNDKDVGSYPIDVTLKTGTDADVANGNYTFTLTSGALTITSDSVTGSLNSDSKPFDSQSISTTFKPTITLTSTDKTNKATIPTVTLNTDDYVFTDSTGTTVIPTTETHVGTYTWKLTDKGVTDVQSQLGTNFSAGDAAMKALTGAYTITPDVLTPTTNDGQRDYNGLPAKTSHAGYTPTVTLTSQSADNKATFPTSIVLTDSDYDYVDANGNVITDTTAVGTYNWKVNATGLKDIYTKLGSQSGSATDANFKIDESKLTGKYTITPVKLTIQTTDGTRVYDGQTIATNHTNSSTSSAYSPKVTFTVTDSTDSVAAPTVVSLDLSDLTFAKGTDQTNADTYNWTVNSDGLKKIYAALGSKTGVSTDANFTIDESKLAGMYTITPAPITITGPTLSKTYDGDAYTGTDDIGKVTGQPGNGVNPVFTMTDISNDKDAKTSYDIVVTVDATAQNNKNYTITTVAGKLTIDKAKVTITAPTLSKTYDGQPYTDSTKNVASLTGVPKDGDEVKYTLASISSDVNAGTYSTSVVETATDNPNYTVTTVDGSLTIGQHELTPATPNSPTQPVNPITPANNQPNANTPQAKTSITIIGASKVYDNNAQTDRTTYDVKGPSDFTDFTVSELTDADFDISGITSQNVGSYTVKLSATGLKKLQDANTNYKFDATNVQDALFVITPRPVTVTANDNSKVFGTTDPTLTTSVETAGKDTGLVAGDSLGTIKVTRAAGEDAKTYPITVSGDTENTNYKVNNVNGTFTITQQALTPATPNTPTQPVNPTAPNDNTPFVGSTQAQTSLTIIGATKVYDNNVTTDPTMYTVKGPSSYKDFTIPELTATDFDVIGITSQNVGSYTVKLSATGLKKLQDANSNYKFDATDVQNALFVITPRPVTVTADNNGKVFGTTDPILTTSVETAGKNTGLVAGDSLGTITATRTAGENVKTYPITVSGDTGNTNYKVNNVDGTFTITQQTLTPSTPNTPAQPVNPTTPADNQPNANTPQAQTSITIIGASKTYDNNAATDTTTYDVKGPSDFKDFTIPTLTDSDFDVTGITSQNIGSYTVKLSATGLKKIKEANPNYKFDATDVQNALFVITPRPVTVTADNNGKVFGATDPTLTATVSGGSGNEQSGLVSGDTLNYTVTREKGETPGDYTTSVTNGTNANYTITDATGTFTITPEVTIKYVDQDGKTLTQAPIKTINDQKVGGVISIAHPTVDNYLVEDNQLTSYTITNNGTQNVTVKYRQNASVITNYYVAGTTNKITDSVSANGGVGLAYSTKAANVTGYTLTKRPANATGIYSANTSDVNYYYTVDYTAVPTDTTGTPIAGVTAPTGTGTPGQTIDPTGGMPTIPGYTVTTTLPDVPNKPGQVNVVYTAKSESVQVNYYVKDSTTTIAPSTTLTGTFKSNYTAASATVAGYTLVSTPENATGAYDLTNKPVDYYYTVDYTAVPVDDSGKQISNVPTKTGTGTPGDTINPNGGMPTIPGYTVSTTLPKVPDKPGQVNVVYTPNTESVKINYYIQGTKTALQPSDTLTGPFDSQYTTTAKTVSGYHLIATPTNATSKFGLNNSDVTFEYAPDTETVKVNYYVEGTTRSITPSTTLTGEFGGRYTTTADKLAGYTLTKMPANATGVYAETNAGVTYYYTVNYTIVPTLPNGTPITDVNTPTGTGSPDDPTNPNGGFPDIPGYTRTTTPVVPGKPGNVAVIYTPDPEEVAVHYYFKGTTTTIPVAKTTTTKGLFGQRYRIDATSFSGYTLVQTPNNAVGTFGLKNQPVNYYYLMDYDIVPVDGDGHVIPNAPTTAAIGLPGAPILTAQLPNIPGYTLVTTTAHVPGQPDTVKVVYVKQQPNEPGKPDQPNKPAQPTQPTNPSQPKQPLQPTQPSTPVQSNNPAQPVSPVTPSHATTVTQPERPTTVMPNDTLATTATPISANVGTRSTHIETTSVHHEVSVMRHDEALPHTGEEDSFVLVAAGLSMMATGFVFMGVRKYRRERHLAERQDEISGKY